MGAMKKFKAVIFDLDDTLYPEIDYVISGFRVTANYISLKLKVEYEEVFNKLLALFKQNRNNVFNRFLEPYNVDEKFIDECIKLYRNHFPDIKLNEEAQVILQLLKKNEFKIGIITDGRPEGQRNKIKALELERYCDSIIITDELGGIEYRKPSEIPYKKIFEQLNVEAREAIYVGDNPVKDFITANKLGMFTIMVKNSNSIHKQTEMSLSSEYLPKTTINNLFDIKELLNLE